MGKGGCLLSDALLSMIFLLPPSLYMGMAQGLTGAGLITEAASVARGGSSTHLVMLRDGRVRCLSLL